MRVKALVFDSIKFGTLVSDSNFLDGEKFVYDGINSAISSNFIEILEFL